MSDTHAAQTPDPLDDAIQPDGSLHNLGWYLSWRKGESHATLDGDFTTADLRAIAGYMEKHNEAVQGV